MRRNPGTTAPSTTAPATAQDEEGWKAFGHALTLAQVLMRSASDPDPDKAMDDVLAGRSTEANRAIAGLLEEATADMPAQYRSRVASIGQDVVSLARKQIATAPVAMRYPAGAPADRALQARKDLTAMGLKYHDPNEFLAAVSATTRSPSSSSSTGAASISARRTRSGSTALEIARAKGNEPMAAASR